MKKIGIFVLALIMTVSLLGCIDRTEEGVETGATKAVVEDSEDEESLADGDVSQTEETSQTETTITTKEKPTTTQKPTTTKRVTTTTEKQEITPPPAVENVETMVWIPQSGSKYHSHSACSNMKNPGMYPYQMHKDKDILLAKNAIKSIIKQA